MRPVTMRLLLIALLFCSAALAQFSSTASHIRAVSALPSTCRLATGDVVFLTSGTKGIYQCLTNNSWSVPGGSSAAGWTDDGTTITATASRNVSLSGLLQFGGATSSFPAFKRSTTTIQARLADDSAYAGFSAASLAIGSDLTKFTVSASGQGIFASNLFASQILNGFQDAGMGVNGSYIGSAKTFAWSSTADATATRDTFLSRLAAGAVGVGAAVGGISATLQSGVVAADPGCTTTAHIGKLWFDITTTTTAMKVCLNVAGTLTWVTK